MGRLGTLSRNEVPKRQTIDLTVVGRLLESTFCRSRKGGSQVRNEPKHRPDLLERATGIEPALAAWEAAVLPLNYARRPRRMVVDRLRRGWSKSIAEMSGY